MLFFTFDASKEICLLDRHCGKGRLSQYYPLTESGQFPIIMDNKLETPTSNGIYSPFGGTIYLYDVGFAYHMIRAVQSLVMVIVKIHVFFYAMRSDKKYLITNKKLKT